MAWIGVALAAASLAQQVSAANKAKKGADAAAQAAEQNAANVKAADEFAALQLEQNAGQAVAASQRVAADQRRNALLVQSRALAVAAASGGGASSPTVVNLMTKIAGEGAYRSSVALYEGEEQSRTLKLQAAAKRYEGELGILGGEAQAQAYRIRGDTIRMQGAGQVLSQGAGLFSKYAGTGPGSGSVVDNYSPTSDMSENVGDW